MTTIKMSLVKPKGKKIAGRRPAFKQVEIF